MATRIATCSLLFAALTTTLASPSAAREPSTRVLVVRALHPALRAAIETGQCRSPTFRDLVRQLEGFDAIVYLVRTSHLPRGIEAALVHWVGGDRTRVLRINLSTRLAGDHLVSVVGHELRHALEALEDPAVVNGNTMRARFDRIEMSRSRVRDSRRPFETEAALEDGRRISGELARATGCTGVRSPVCQDRATNSCRED